MVSDVEHLFMCLLVIYFIVSSSVYMSTNHSLGNSTPGSHIRGWRRDGIKGWGVILLLHDDTKSCELVYC